MVGTNLRRNCVVSCGLALAVVLVWSAIATAQGPGFRGGRGPGGLGPGGTQQGGLGRGGPGRGGMGRGHMGPGGGRGPDENFVADRDVFHFLLEHHTDIRREVEELPNGVSTVTESDVPQVADKIQEHVVAMYERIEKQRPIRMRDPLFAELFRHADKVKMEWTPTEKGVRVVETSDDAHVASLIKEHAKVVSLFVKRGFDEAHLSHPLPGEPQAAGQPLHPEGHPVDMVFMEFDRVYIPALAGTSRGPRDAAERALDRLARSWDARFVSHFTEMFPEDTQWPRDVSQTAQAIARAQVFFQHDEMPAAHEALEPVRNLLMQARVRNTIDYPLDPLSRFHDTMEKIVMAAQQERSAPLTAAELQEFKVWADTAQEQWQEVESTHFPFASFGKSAGFAAAFEEMLKVERQALQMLQNALQAGDSPQVLKTAVALKPPFAKVYMAFGDFP